MEWQHTCGAKREKVNQQFLVLNGACFQLLLDYINKLSNRKKSLISFARMFVVVVVDAVDVVVLSSTKEFAARP